MNCPECGSDTKVIDSRDSLYRRDTNGVAISCQPSVRRRRVCPVGHRFTTHESIAEEGLMQRLELLESRFEDMMAAFGGLIDMPSISPAPQSQNRTERVMVSLSEDERAEIERGAMLNNMSQSRYARTLMLRPANGAGDVGT